jgi:hypothetical protein
MDNPKLVPQKVGPVYYNYLLPKYTKKRAEKATSVLMNLNLPHVQEGQSVSQSITTITVIKYNTTIIILSSALKSKITTTKLVSNIFYPFTFVELYGFLYYRSNSRR